MLKAQSGQYLVELPDGLVTAVLRGRVKKDRLQDGLVALGDRVRVERLEGPTGRGDTIGAVIREILPRASVLARRAPGPKGVWSQDVIVANVDILAVVMACRRPEPNWRLLDRFLAVAEISDIDCVIVLNKADLGVSAEVSAGSDRYRAIGYPVLLVSVVTGEGLEGLRERLQRGVAALCGPSGAGKSSLLNALDPALSQRIGDVSEAVDKGRHTTRVGQLHRLACGGLVADTPGLREMGVWDVDSGLLEWAFVDFRPHLAGCRFDDCTHSREPDCAVRQAVEQGAIAAERYESYLCLLADASPGAPSQRPARPEA